MQWNLLLGGGFIKTAAELESGDTPSQIKLPFEFHSAEELLSKAKQQGRSIGRLVEKNELALRSQEEIDNKTEQIWKVISLCLQRGLQTEGILDGGLNAT